jgi:hypothetical protein
LRSFDTLPLTVNGQAVDEDTLKELLRRKSVNLSNWDPKTGTGVISCPAANGNDLTAYFGAQIDDKTVPFSLVVPAKFAGSLKANDQTIEIAFSTPLKITFLGPIHDYSVPPIALYKMQIDSTRIVYSATELASPDVTWKVQINLR